MEQLKNIQELSEIRKRVQFLESQILKPELTEVSHIPTLFEFYNKITSDVNDYPDKESAEYKQIFLYSILMLYCPRALMGEHLSRGIREHLANLFDRSPSHVSNLISGITFYYERYTKFRHNCDHILSQMNIKINRL